MTTERGRPRSFDADEALDQALAVFWRHGFQGASLSDLTAATGLSKPSLYAAFGDKESLYLRAFERYAEQQIGQRAAVLDAEPDARAALRRFLRAMAAMLTDPALPGGCFIINGMADVGGTTTPAAVEEALRRGPQSVETLLRERLQRAQREGQLPAGASAEAWAAMFGTLVAGLGVQAKSGAKRTKLEGVIDAALAVWPDAPARKRAGR